MYSIFSCNQIHLLTVLVIVWLPNSTSSSQSYWSRAITIILSEGKEDCYYLPDIEASKEVSIEYRVTNTRSVWAGSNIDIAFNVYSPNGNGLVSNDHSSHGSYFLKTDIRGDYKICVDNGRLSPGNKEVYLKIEVADNLAAIKQLLVISENASEGRNSNLIHKDMRVKPHREMDFEIDPVTGIMEGGDGMLESFPYKIMELTIQLDDIKDTLDTYSSIFSSRDRKQAQDYHLLQNTRLRVDLRSYIQISILIITSLAQVYVMRKFFDG